MEKMKMVSADSIESNIEKIGALFPNVLTESKNDQGAITKSIDFEKLKEILSGEISEGKESYEFTWPGKKEALLKAYQPIRKTLRPITERSQDWDLTENLYIEGDNLEALKLLQESYLGKVKTIYIDPPYNTGNDFIYKDDFSETVEEYQQKLEATDEETGNKMIRNTGTNGRIHSDWCSMMYSRLLLARNLMAEDGTIFISIDENEMVNLRQICNEVFGSQQFIGQISMLCNPKGRSQDKYIANCHEYILIYSLQELPAGSVSIPKTEEDVASDYKLSDDLGPYRELELRNTHREFGKFNRQNLWYPFYVSNDGSVSLTTRPGAIEVYPVWDDGFEGCWTWGKEKAEKELNLLVAKKVKDKFKIYRKSYAFVENERPLKQVKSIWTDKELFTEKGQKVVNELFQTKQKIFQSPKSVDLIKRCIQMSQNKDGIVLDFFGGSSSTAQAVMELNNEDKGQRKYILVQFPEQCDPQSDAYKNGYKTITEIGQERIKRFTNSISDSKTDKGFRCFSIDSSNMNDVFYSAESYQQDLLSLTESNIKPDRSDLDLLFGCLIEWGLELSKPYHSEVVDQTPVHIYDDNSLIACFSESIPESVIREIASRQPLRAVFRDSSFVDDAARVNVEEIFKLLSPDTEVKVI